MPDHGTEFRLRMERQAVIDAPDVSVPSLQTVAALPVRVVGDQVKERDALELFGEFLLVLKEISPAIMINEELHGAHAIWSISDHSARNEPPAKNLTCEIRSIFTSVQGASREVPERSFTPLGFIDGDRLGLPLQLQLHGKGVVGAPGDHLHGFHVAVPQDAPNALRR